MDSSPYVHHVSTRHHSHIGIPRPFLFFEARKKGVNALLYVARHVSLVPRLSWNANMYRVESLVSFIRNHDVIKIGPKQKGNVLHVVQPAMLQHSVCMIFDAR